MTKNGHKMFRIACFERGLSMQEVVEAFVQKIGIKHPHMIKFLDEVVENKKNKTLKKFSKNDVNSIFEILEDDDPLKEK